ncbi:MAG: hypothetical protein H7A25_09450 [Leptospiraceae bacterium]|nr:hypothetical protein [Leptospiraceae bacterium]MCP5500115.1 hypothetical protein [Leptospiraceae bacterium]
MTGLEILPWAGLVWSFLKPVIGDYIDPEKYLQGKLKDFVKEKEKSYFKRFTGLFGKKEADGGNYLYSAFSKAYTRALYSCLSDWQKEVASENIIHTDLPNRLKALCKDLSTKEKIEELFGAPDREREEKVLESMMIDSGGRDTRYQQIEEDGAYLNILNLIAEKIHNTS